MIWHPGIEFQQVCPEHTTRHSAHLRLFSLPDQTPGSVSDELSSALTFGVMCDYRKSSSLITDMELPCPRS
jgi:hypothetical protein